MRRLIGWAAAGILAVALAGCAAEPAHPTGGCASCTNAWVKVGKQTSRQTVCIEEAKGDQFHLTKIYDCTKNPPECPECAKKGK